MKEINLIEIGWNNFNGFNLEILNIEIGNFEGKLFGISFGYKSYLMIDILFINFEIKLPINF